MNKQELFALGKARVDEFLTENGWPLVPIIEAKRGTNYGWYRDGLIAVYVKKTLVPVKTPGRGWTYPGYKADLTALGVCCHECGHHVWAMQDFDYTSTEVAMKQRRDWDDIVRDEAPVSGYEPWQGEAFAEAMKLFLTNPDLLRVGRPRRHAFLTQALQLKPVVNLPWQEVLKDAHPKFHSAATNWIKKGKVGVG